MTDTGRSGESPGRIDRRTLLGGAAAAAGVGLFNINHAWSKDVVYNGEVFDAGGAEVRIGEWGGFWEDSVRKFWLNDFEKQYNCKVLWDSSFPWFPKFVAAGVKNPPYAITNWNLPEMYKTARAGDFFMPLDEVIPNVPNAAGLWDFATRTKIGITWTYGQYSFGYRTDLADPPPAKFVDFWQPRFAGKRATYITSNTLQMVFFLTSAAVFGKDEYDLKAGYDAMKRVTPIKQSDFTGNMQTLLERGEIATGVQWEGEMYAMEDRGVKVSQYIWQEKKPLLTQTKTISRYTDPMQKKLAFALMNRTLDPGIFGKFADVFYMRPAHKDVVITPKMAAKGVTNTAESTQGYWIPDWPRYLDHEDEIVDTVNGIFSA